MNAIPAMDDPPVRARIPADLDSPDQLVAGLTARQLALLAGAAAPLYLAWQMLSSRVPLPVLAAITATLAAIAVAVALGRRDGLSLDRWLLAALRHQLRPHRLAPAPAQGAVPLPAWAPNGSGPGRDRGPGALLLPVEAIGGDGVIITAAATATVLVAASTVTAGLHTPGEQAMLLAGYARWLNSLTAGVQIVVSARSLDLGARALHVGETAARLPHPALAAAAIAHAEHLLDLCEDSDRLIRTVTIACTATTTGTSVSRAEGSGRDGDSTARQRSGAGGEAARQAARTAAAVSVLGSRCRVLDGADATAVLSAAVDPWGPAEAGWSRTPPGAVVTAGPALIDQADGIPVWAETPDGADDGWAEADVEEADVTGWTR